jgi:hypothetical protein
MKRSEGTEKVPMKKAGILVGYMFTVSYLCSVKKQLIVLPQQGHLYSKQSQ